MRLLKWGRRLDYLEELEMNFCLSWLILRRALGLDQTKEGPSRPAAWLVLHTMATQMVLENAKWVIYTNMSPMVVCDAQAFMS